jgi:hypothetical protein
MALFTEQQLINRAQNELRKGGTSIYDTAENKAIEFINESKRSQRIFSAKKYDIFLSHSSDDARYVAGLKLELEDLGYSVYVDWIADPELDRSDVTKNNAALLRTRMKQCTSLLYAFTKNASTSTWMPWELGYFDGIKGFVAIVPISKTGDSSFNGNEYLGLYPYIDIQEMTATKKQCLWVNESANVYVAYDQWIKGVKPIKR